MCIRDSYEAEQRELKERAAAIQAELSKAQEATVNAEKFMNVVRRHTTKNYRQTYRISTKHTEQTMPTVTTLSVRTKQTPQT